MIELSRRAQLIVEAQVRVALAGQVKTNPRYQTLFYGLKKNHPHNVALVHPMFFLLRRILFAAVIVFLYDRSFFAVLTLLLISLGILTFAVCEKQWENGLINQQHIFNEIALYLCLVLLFVFSGTPQIESKFGSTFFGWLLIGFVILFCAYNGVVIIVSTIRFF